MNLAEKSMRKEASVTVQDVWEAKKRIASIVCKTPLIYSRTLSTRVGANIYLKCEQLHESGAFKMRGAANALACLSRDQRRHGVTTFSTGNHGLAVAIAAKKLGVQATICVSKHVPDAKKDLIRSLGAELKVVGESQDDAEKLCYKLQNEEGMTVIPPFDHPNVIAGQGTMALEILEDLPNVSCVIAGLSGGGLLSGIGLVMKHTHPSIKVIGLSMEKGAAMYESLRAGHPVVVDEHPTLADSLLGGLGQNNRYTFSIIQNDLDESLLIPESTIARGMAYLYKYHHMVAEGAGAISTGALLDGQLSVTPSSNVVLIISGCNVDLKAHAAAIQPYLQQEDRL